MKKRVLFVLVCTLCIVFALSACSQSQEQSSEASGQDTQQQLTGEIVNATKDTLILKLDDGNEYTFSTEGTDFTSLADGLNVGASVKLTYTGALNGTDTAGVTVIRVEDA